MSSSVKGSDGGLVRPVELELTILMPCLNEAETIGVCIRKAQAFLARKGVAGEVVVADNGSTDESREIARQHGARLVNASTRGYGAALLGGIEAARGRYIVMGDADDSYDFSSLDEYLEQLRGGADLVMGNRFRGGIAPGSMPFIHRYLGNPALSFLGRLFFKIPVGDFHCGLRAFKTESIRSLRLQTTGMEFASEMVVRCALRGLRIVEVPTPLKPDGRSRAPHLKTWRDGWRHLKFLLMYSPRWLFFIPGFSMIAIGLLLAATLFFGPVKIFGGCHPGHRLVHLRLLPRYCRSAARVVRRSLTLLRGPRGISFAEYWLDDGAPPFHHRPACACWRAARRRRGCDVRLCSLRLGAEGIRPTSESFDPTRCAYRHDSDRYWLSGACNGFFAGNFRNPEEYVSRPSLEVSFC